MPSKAHQNWEIRVKEIQQLLDAHSALVRFKKAEDAITKGAGDLRNIAKVVDALTLDPTQGKPPEVQALNSAAIALLSAHLQGFVTELYEEACDTLLKKHVPSVEALKKASPSRGNPNVDNIKKLFGSIGFGNVIEGISWSRMGNEALKKKLRDFNELRNRIVHGKSENVTKSSVINYLNVWTNFAKHLDRKVHDEIKKVMKKEPWQRG